MWSKKALARVSSFGSGMTDPIDDAYDAWKEADAAARQVERAVDEAWLRHDRGLGAPPTKGMLRELAYLRQHAGEKLGEAIILLHEVGCIQPPAPAGERLKRLRAE